MRLKWMLYRGVMRLAHRYNWHHAVVLRIDGGDVQTWCQWCGFRQTVKRAGDKPAFKAAFPRRHQGEA
jgi:hypothetical protein